VLPNVFKGLLLGGEGRGKRGEGEEKGIIIDVSSS